MRYLAILLLFLFTLQSHAGVPSGSYYNPDREGEGIDLYVEGETLVFHFFTYYDSVVAVLPTVSPAPPPPVELTCRNEGVWFLGIAQNWDGQEASGNILLARALDYPNVDPLTDQLEALIEVGGFTITSGEGGFELNVTGNGYFPASMYMFNNTFHFHKLIID